MVTDIKTNYTSPAGKECSFAAARFAGINPSSRVWTWDADMVKLPVVLPQSSGVKLQPVISVRITSGLHKNLQ